MNTPKVAVITGASQGIGAALVVGYRKLGPELRRLAKGYR